MNDVDAVVPYAEVVDDLLAGGAGDGEHGGQAARDALLHPGEGVPAADRVAAPPAVGGVEFELPVDGDGVVDGGDEGRAHVAQEAVAEGLVVVDDVEVAAAGPQMAAGAQREREGFGEAAGPHRADLERVDPVPVLAPLRGAEGIGLAVEVEAGQLGEREPVADEGAVVEDGVGLGADDLDAVAEAGQFAGEVADVDALPAAERVPLVGEEGDAQRWQAVGGWLRTGTRLTGLGGHSGPPPHCAVPRHYVGRLI